MRLFRQLNRVNRNFWHGSSSDMDCQRGCSAISTCRQVANVSLLRMVVSRGSVAIGWRARGAQPSSPTKRTDYGCWKSLNYPRIGCCQSDANSSPHDGVRSLMLAGQLAIWRHSASAAERRCLNVWRSTRWRSRLKWLVRCCQSNANSSLDDALILKPARA